jgi:hypothetical protein
MQKKGRDETRAPGTCCSPSQSTNRIHVSVTNSAILSVEAPNWLSYNHLQLRWDRSSQWFALLLVVESIVFS